MPDLPEELDEFAVLDLGRRARKGVPEVVYAKGKTSEQVARICETLLASSERVVVSAPSPEVVAELKRSLSPTPMRNAGRSVVLGAGEPARSGGRAGAISAGTSDLPVLEGRSPWPARWAWTSRVSTTSGSPGYTA